MISLVDGPAKGAHAVKRAPMFLRAVIAADGKADVLDQLDDVARPDEKIHVYRREGEAGMVHLNFGGGKRGRATGFYATGRYLYVPGVDGEAVRDNDAWRAWVMDQIPRPV